MSTPYTYDYSRYHTRESRTYDTLEEALESAWVDFEFEQANPLCIRQGERVLLEGEALRVEILERMDRFDGVLDEELPQEEE